ncbi:hypothetical protein HPB48_008006 [Haemaphysalis longicornis]|uniref:Uncharacterized protein n=1 Tax=Haemaphysalis longicornis TaxID=44386 RepID=A0A9J6FTS3_HAELO|nr:hypothetical protein HPB48_008006 [Haemaphysalis longicornis]
MLCKTHVFFLWIWLCSTEGILAYLPCHLSTNLTTLPREFKNCNLSFENSRLHALCHILVKFPANRLPGRNAKITMEHLLVSEDTVHPMSQGCAPVCLSLRRAEINKWDYFPQNLYSSVEHIELEELSSFERQVLYAMRASWIWKMTFSVTYNKPPPVAVAMCDGKRGNRSGIVSVCSFPVPCHQAFAGPDYFSVPENTTTRWNIFNVYTDVVITIGKLLKKTTSFPLYTLPSTPIRHVAFHRCFFQNISFNNIPLTKSIQHLEFSQSPIETIHPDAFNRIPSVKKLSLTSTKLSGIPEAIFSLKTLAYLNMSDTDVPPGEGFNFWPGSRNKTSSAVQLITSGSNVTLLRDRDLCGFPNLDELHMDGCHLKILLGSPFICLEKLQVLSLRANEIPTLNEATLEGLTGLLWLNLTRNRLTVLMAQLYSIRWCPCEFLTYPSTAYNSVWTCLSTVPLKCFSPTTTE